MKQRVLQERNEEFTRKSLEYLEFPTERLNRTEEELISIKKILTLPPSLKGALRSPPLMGWDPQGGRESKKNENSDLNNVSIPIEDWKRYGKVVKENARDIHSKVVEYKLPSYQKDAIDKRLKNINEAAQQ